MRTSSVKQPILLAAFCALAWAGPASAQDINPETGDVVHTQGGAQFGGSFQAGGQSGAQASTTAPASTPQPAPAEASSSMTADPTAAASTVADAHSAVVGHFGVGFFGVMDLPLMGCGGGFPPCGVDPGRTLAAPSIGARYWLGDMLGLEAALGLHYASTSAGNVDTSAFGLALHGGVPLALAHSGNFVFEVVPQLNLGFTTGSYSTTGMNATNVDVSGFLVELGGKVGAEIHFGFIDLPQLSLQGTLGLMIRHESRSADIPTGAPGGATTSIDQSATDIATGVDGPPWSIFIGNLSAIYYFGV